MTLLQESRRQAVMQAVHANPDGISSGDLVLLIGIKIGTLKLVLQQLQRDGLIELVAYGNTKRWALPELAATVHQQMAEQQAHWRRLADQAAEDADDPILTAKRVIVRAGDVPPPATRAPRSIFDMGYQR